MSAVRKLIKNDFDILSLQRNLKILGIFVRLYKRDGKRQYLKYIPYILIIKKQKVGLQISTLIIIKGL